MTSPGSSAEPLGVQRDGRRDVRVGEHRALGRPGRARRVAQHRHVVRTRGHRLEATIGSRTRDRQRGRPCRRRAPRPTRRTPAGPALPARRSRSSSPRPARTVPGSTGSSTERYPRCEATTTTAPLSDSRWAASASRYIGFTVTTTAPAFQAPSAAMTKCGEACRQIATRSPRDTPCPARYAAKPSASAASSACVAVQSWYCRATRSGPPQPPRRHGDQIGGGLQRPEATLGIPPGPGAIEDRLVTGRHRFPPGVDPVTRP